MTNQFQKKIDFGKGVNTDVYVGLRALDHMGQALSGLDADGRVFIIADSALPQTTTKLIADSINGAGYSSVMLTTELNEKTKTLSKVSEIYDWLATHRAERRELILAVGGGVASDLVGFVASSWLRGVPFGIVSTTLLGMVDASIGGKTGFNLSHGKNLVGSFSPAQFVIQDLRTLESLNNDGWRTGLAEVIKLGLALDSDLFWLISSKRKPILARDMECTLEIIRVSIDIKVKTIGNDIGERTGRRILLNYGHTVGHALENLSNYGALTHGNAISIGMMVAGYIAHSEGLIDESILQRQKAILEEYGLPTQSRNFKAENVLEASLNDKKVRGGRINWVLLSGLGKSTVRNDIGIETVLKCAKEVLVG